MIYSSLFDGYYHDLGIFLYLTPIISACWAGFALLANRNCSRSQVYLAVVFFMLAIAMTFSFWYDRYNTSDRTEILRAVNPIMSMFCSLSVLFYITSLIRPEKLTFRYLLTYIIPAVVGTLIIVGLEYKYGVVQYTLKWEEIRTRTQQPVVFIRLGALALLLFFEMLIGFKCIRMYFRHKKFIRESYSYEEGIGLNWIGMCIFLFGVFAVVDLFWMIYSDILYKVLFGIMAFTIIVFLFWLGFRQKEVPTEAETSTGKPPSVNPAETLKVETVMDVHVTAHRTQEKIKQALLDYFREEHPYLNPDLNLGDIATALHTNKTYLSKMINGEFGINFYTFVNQYRIHHVISLIEHHSEGEPIANHLFMESGFKSRSVFYKTFKEITGLSPADYITRWRSDHLE